MSKNIKYEYLLGQSMCTIKYKGKEFMGIANCHPDDMDFESERVGMTIAETRANIKVLCFMRDCEIKPQLKSLNHLYSNIKTSKYFNPNSYESKMLLKQIKSIKKELDIINNALVDERRFIKDYINGKDKLYKKLRAKNK